MSKITAILGSALFFVVAPAMLAGVVVIAYEEPTLRQSYGAEYESYCANVPRWLSRLAPRAV